MSPSIILWPFTLTSGLGVFNVIGSKRALNPAARNTALFTLYGSKAIRPSRVMPSASIKPSSVSSLTCLLVFPKDCLVNSLNSLWVSLPLEE